MARLQVLTVMTVALVLSLSGCGERQDTEKAQVQEDGYVEVPIEQGMDAETRAEFRRVTELSKQPQLKVTISENEDGVSYGLMGRGKDGWTYVLEARYVKDDEKMDSVLRQIANIDPDQVILIERPEGVSAKAIEDLKKRLNSLGFKNTQVTKAPPDIERGSNKPSGADPRQSSGGTP